MGRQFGWQLPSGSAAEANERYLVPAFSDAWAQDLVEVAAVQAGQRVLDLACGAGVVARHAAKAVGTAGRVVGLDVNTAMLEVARAVPQYQEGASIEWREGDAVALPFAEAEFDRVLCHQGLQFFRDRAAALHEVFRVLVPGGRLALGVWRRLEHLPFYAR
jgi:ubiquinone/menaquinone biosynthesis C-methylase UbiE